MTQGPAAASIDPLQPCVKEKGFRSLTKIARFFAAMARKMRCRDESWSATEDGRIVWSNCSKSVVVSVRKAPQFAIISVRHGSEATPSAFSLSLKRARPH